MWMRLLIAAAVAAAIRYAAVLAERRDEDPPKGPRPPRPQPPGWRRRPFGDCWRPYLLVPPGACDL